MNKHGEKKNRFCTTVKSSMKCLHIERLVLHGTKNFWKHSVKYFLFQVVVWAVFSGSNFTVVQVLIFFEGKPTYSFNELIEYLESTLVRPCLKTSGTFRGEMSTVWPIKALLKGHYCSTGVASQSCKKWFTADNELDPIS